VAYAQPGEPVIHFNEPSSFNGWWDSDAWRNRHAYQTVYGSDRDGLTLSIDQDGSVVSGRGFS
jgi:hypothetical protein